MFLHEQIEIGYEDLEAITGDKGRVYITPEGNKLPSITTVLSILSRDSIAKWRARVGAEEANKISAKASRRGTAVHDIIEKYVKNDPDYRKGHQPHVLESFLAVQDLLDTKLTKVYAQEVALYSKYLGVAGRVDCVGEWEGIPSIIDFKTSARKKSADHIESYFMQECFYSIAWEERTGMPITQLVTLIAVDNELPQVFVEHRDNWDTKLIETIKQYKGENK